MTNFPYLGTAADTSHLRFLNRVTIVPTPGKDTLAQASDVFTARCDPNLKNWGTDIAGEDTVEQEADIFEMKKDGDYRTLFGSFGADSRFLRLSQGQIKEFCRSHHDHLCQEGSGTLFLFEVGDVPFVVRVGVLTGWPMSHVYHFDDGDVLNSLRRHRVVVPRQTV